MSFDGALFAIVYVSVSSVALIMSVIGLVQDERRRRRANSSSGGYASYDRH